MVKVAFYKGKGTWMNALIRWWTNGPYSHTEVIVDENGGASLCYTSAMEAGGVRRAWRVLNPSDWDIVTIDYDRISCQDWYEGRMTAKYDTLGLLGLVFKRDRYNRNKYFCSEATAESIGIRDGWRYDPNALKPIVDRLANKT